jgi:hypothetical protein
MAAGVSGKVDDGSRNIAVCPNRTAAFYNKCSHDIWFCAEIGCENIKLSKTGK